MKLLKRGGLALGGALVLALFAAMVVSALTRGSTRVTLDTRCSGGTAALPCQVERVAAELPGEYGDPKAPVRAFAGGCRVRLRVALRPSYREGDTPPPRTYAEDDPGGSAVTDRFADGRTLTREVHGAVPEVSVTLTVPEGGVVHELRAVPVPTGCRGQQAVDTAADDLERAFSYADATRAKGVSSSQNGLLPSAPTP